MNLKCWFVGNVQLKVSKHLIAWNFLTLLCVVVYSFIGEKICTENPPTISSVTEFGWSPF